MSCRTSAGSVLEGQGPVLAGSAMLTCRGMSPGFMDTGVLLIRPGKGMQARHCVWLSCGTKGIALPVLGRMDLRPGTAAKSPSWWLGEGIAAEPALGEVASTTRGWGYDLRVPECGEYMLQRGCVAHFLTDIVWRRQGDRLHMFANVQMRGPHDLEVPPGGWFSASGPIRDGYALLTYIIHLAAGARVRGCLLVPMHSTDAYHHCFWLCQAPGDFGETLLNHPVLVLGILTLSRSTKCPAWTMNGLAANLPLPPASSFRDWTALAEPSLDPTMCPRLPEDIEALVAENDRTLNSRLEVPTGAASLFATGQSTVLHQGKGWLEFVPLLGMRGYLDTTGSALSEIRSAKVMAGGQTVTAEGAICRGSSPGGTSGAFAATGVHDMDVGLLTFSMTGDLLQASGIMVLPVKHKSKECHGFFLALPGPERRLPSFGRISLAEGELPTAPSRAQGEIEKPTLGPIGSSIPSKAILQRAQRPRETQEFVDITKTLIARSKAMGVVFKFVELASTPEKRAPVLLHGEPGTGKQFVAETIHRLSSRNEGPFVQVNCGSASAASLGWDLFGAEDWPGRVVLANGGTLFLDEIESLSLEHQARMLTLIDHGRFSKAGQSDEQEVDIRVIAATDRSLEAMVPAGTFRPDLYYLLRTLACRVPSLKERIEDIPDLARHFLTELERSCGRQCRITDEALGLLQACNWPGNAKQLGSVVEGAFYRAHNMEITAANIVATIHACPKQQVVAPDIVKGAAPLKCERIALVGSERNGSLEIEAEGGHSVTVELTKTMYEIVYHLAKKRSDDIADGRAPAAAGEMDRVKLMQRVKIWKSLDYRNPNDDHRRLLFEMMNKMKARIGNQNVDASWLNGGAGYYQLTMSIDRERALPPTCGERDRAS